jgi:hypothetical protein
MKLRQVLGLALGLVLAGAVSASAQDVRYNFDKQADFAKFKTYKWVAIKGAEKPNDMVDSQIKKAVDAQLATKGLTATNADTADLYIGYQVAVSTEKQYTSFDTGWGYGPGYGGGWYGGGGMSTTTGTTSTIYIGQIAIDMYSTASKTLVWRGERVQDDRHEGEAREAGKKPGEGHDEALQELSAAASQGQEIVFATLGARRSPGPEEYSPFALDWPHPANDFRPTLCRSGLGHWPVLPRWRPPVCSGTLGPRPPR